MKPFFVVIVEKIWLILRASKYPILRNNFQKEPNFLISLFFGIVMLLILDVGLAAIVLILQDLEQAAGIALLGGALGLRFIFGIFAAHGYKPSGPKAINYFGMIMLSFIPIGSWLALYYAGKAIARRTNTEFALLTIFMILFIGFLAYNSSGMLALRDLSIQNIDLMDFQNSLNPAPSKKSPNAKIMKIPSVLPTPTNRQIPTLKPTMIPTQTFTIPSNCYPSNEIAFDMLGDHICLYGKVSEITKYWEFQGQSGEDTELTLVDSTGHWFAIVDTWKLHRELVKDTCWIVNGRVSLLSGCAEKDERCLFLRINDGYPCK